MKKNVLSLVLFMSSQVFAAPFNNIVDQSAYKFADRDGHQVNVDRTRYFLGTVTPSASLEKIWTTEQRYKKDQTTFTLLAEKDSKFVQLQIADDETRPNVLSDKDSVTHQFELCTLQNAKDGSAKGDICYRGEAVGKYSVKNDKVSIDELPSSDAGNVYLKNGRFVAGSIEIYSRHTKYLHQRVQVLEQNLKGSLTLIEGISKMTEGHNKVLKELVDIVAKLNK